MSLFCQRKKMFEINQEFFSWKIMVPGVQKKYIFLSPITRLLLVVTRNGFKRFTLLLIDGRIETSRAPYYGGKISGSQQ